MADYHGALRQLDAAVADAVDDLLAIREKLIRAQQRADDILIESPEPEIKVLPIKGEQNQPDPPPKDPAPQGE